MDITNREPSNFGGGIEFLMNEKATGGHVGGDSSDIANIEAELNSLSGGGGGADEHIDFNSNIPTASTFEDATVRFSNDVYVDDSANPSGVGIGGEQRDWDGYSKMNNIPSTVPPEPQMSKEELLKEKFKYLKKLEALERKNVELTKKYSMESPLMEMQGEYEMIMEEKRKENSVKFQGNMMMTLVNGLEYLNSKFDPFDIYLDGLGDQVGENISDYDDVFGELYEKYKSKASMAPELKLLMQLGFNASLLHMTNSVCKSAPPGVDDILRQNPELMQQFQSAAVNSMSNSAPGFSKFMNSMGTPPDPTPSRGGPPPPVATQSGMPPTHRSGNNDERPDISRARGNFANDGMDMNTNFNLNQPQPAEQSKRPEMKGPSGIDNILSGLKTKTINIAPDANSPNDNNSSTISASELKSIQSDANMPKKSKRRPRTSEKNTVSIDI
jgi:hypothetical protein